MEKAAPVRSQATIAAINGLVPTMFIARLGTAARTGRAISAATLGSVLVRKCVAPMRAFTRAERVLDRLATLAHGLWVCIKPLVNSLEQMLHAPIV